MGAYIYASGTYHPLEGNKVVSGGTMTAMKASDVIIVDGSCYTLGDPAANANVISGAVIESRRTFTNATLQDVTVGNGGYVTVIGGTVQNLTVGSGGSAFLNGVESTAGSITVTSSGYVDTSNCNIKNIVGQSKSVYKQCGGTLSSWNGIGSVYIQECSISSQIVSNGGSLFVSSGGTANYISAIWAGLICVLDGGNTYHNATVSSGRVVVSSGGTANYTSARNRGLIYIGGVANNMYVSGSANYDGSAVVLSGGTARAISLGEHSYLAVSSGGYALSVIKEAGYYNVFADEGSIVTYANN